MSSRVVYLPSELRKSPPGSRVATDRVYVDERRVRVVALDGTDRATVDTVGDPVSVGWSLAGDQLLVATIGNKAAGVVRFKVR